MSEALTKTLTALLDRLSPGSKLLLAAVLLLAVGGPLYRESVAGLIHDPMAGWLAGLYLVVVIATWGLLAVAVVLFEPGLWAERKITTAQQDEVRFTSVALGAQVEVFAALAQEVWCEADPDERALKGQRALDYFIPAACEIFREAEGANRAILFVPDEDGSWLVPHKRAHYNFTPEKLEAIRLPIPNSVAGYVYEEQRPYLTGVSGAAKDPRYHRIPEHQPPGSLLCVPVFGSGETPAAVLSVDSDRRDAFREENILHLQVVASRISDVVVALGGLEALS